MQKKLCENCLKTQKKNDKICCPFCKCELPLEQYPKKRYYLDNRNDEKERMKNILNTKKYNFRFNHI